VQSTTGVWSEPSSVWVRGSAWTCPSVWAAVHGHESVCTRLCDVMSGKMSNLWNSPKSTKKNWGRVQCVFYVSWAVPDYKQNVSFYSQNENRDSHFQGLLIVRLPKMTISESQDSFYKVNGEYCSSCNRLFCSLICILIKNDVSLLQWIDIKDANHR